MKNPLSEEQQKKLLEISKLEPEKQKQEWVEFSKTLSKERFPMDFGRTVNLLELMLSSWRGLLKRM